MKIQLKESYRFLTFSFAYGLVAVAHKGFGLLLFFWLARTLSQNDYAIFGLLYALQTGLITIATAGIIEMVIGRNSITKKEGRQRLYDVANGTFFWLTLLAAVASIIIHIGFISNYVTFYDVILVYVSGVFLAFFSLQSSYYRLDENHARSLLLTFWPPFLGLLFAYVGFLIWENLTAFFGLMAASLLVTYFIFHWLRLVDVNINIRVNRMVSIKNEIIPFIIIALLAWLSGYGSTYLVETMFSMVVVAKFMFAYTLSSILQIVATSLNQVWSPRFFIVAHELPANKLERRNIIFYFGQGIILGLSGMAVLIILDPMIDIVGGNLSNYRDTGQGLAWLFAGYAVSAPWWHAQNYYYIHKQGGQLMRLVVLSTVLGIMVWLALMYILGEIGIYIGFFSLMLIRSLVVWMHARAVWSIRFAWHGPFIAICIIMAGFIIS